MNAFRLTLAFCACVFSACGSGSVCFGGNCSGNNNDDQQTVTVEGNLDSVVPPNAVRDVVVFVYTKLESQDLADGAPFNDYKDADSAVVTAEDKFTVDRVTRGNLTVIVLLDAATPDGTIDPGDECSVLLDGGDLNDVNGGRRVDIQDIDVDFRESSCPGTPPAAGCGCARANDILVVIDRPSSETAVGK